MDTSLSIACWTGSNIWPEDFDHATRLKMEHDYKAMPEEFHSTTKLPVVAPSTVNHFRESVFSNSDEGFAVEIQEVFPVLPASY